MKLTDSTIRNACAVEKPLYLFDGAGLYLEVSPAGGKLWRLKYRFDGKGRLLALGKYPAVSLKEARERREEAKKLLANGADPGAVKKAQKAALIAATENTFEAVACEWFNVWKAGVAPDSATRQWSNLERHILPHLGSVPVSEVTPKVILNVLRKMEEGGLGNTVRKSKTAISQIMRHAVQTDRADRDPVPDLKGALKKTQTRHMPAITDPVKAGALLRAIDGYQGQPEVIAALKLAPLFFVRPGEICAAKWADFDLEKGEWKYTVSKTKTEHLVPLARQAVDILRGLHVLTGHCPLVFPGHGSMGRPISENTINAALRRMGYDTKNEMTGHGFRAMARTLLAEELRWQPEVIEHQLAHSVPDALGRAYNRTKYLKERTAMMQEWADYLDQLRTGAAVIQLRA
ncbi:MAG: integrase arm-type DNA-binding domain-containing protein [Zoogloeaceae bacterium]|jgi:integrase|nr:integrase arm-type DNA-binding domain-containing protein [Zoogloeaceae bacterium]